MVLTTKEASYIIVLGIVISVLPISSTWLTVFSPQASSSPLISNHFSEITYFTVLISYPLVEIRIVYSPHFNNYEIMNEFSLGSLYPSAPINYWLTDYLKINYLHIDCLQFNTLQIHLPPINLLLINHLLIRHIQVHHHQVKHLWNNHLQINNVRINSHQIDHIEIDQI